jgi:hypothetical protein
LGFPNPQSHQLTGNQNWLQTFHEAFFLDTKCIYSCVRIMYSLPVPTKSKTDASM